MLANAYRNFRAMLSNRVLMLMVFMFVLAGNALAQTPVPIVVPTNTIFTQANNWIAVFAPIIAIGAGISIALAILSFIVGEIVKAFR
jgi:hypothetical protein